MAEYNQKDNTIYIYDQPGVKEKDGGVGQFFPFNKAPQIMELARDDSQVNNNALLPKERRLHQTK